MKTGLTCVADINPNHIYNMAQAASVEELLKAGAHFGHLTRRWNPKMREFIFMQRNGIHIIDLKKTHNLLQEAVDEVGKIARSGKNVLFVGTKKQAQDIIKQEADRCGMPYVTDRWLGGMLTNFVTMKKSISRMDEIKAMRTDGTYENITKKERLMLDREQEKLENVLYGISKMSRLPGAIFIVDIVKERIAVNEALKLNIPIFAMVDTNCDPDVPDYIIPANDDAAKSIQLVASNFADAIIEGEAEREAFQEKELAKEAVDQEAASTEETPETVSEEDVKKARPKRTRRKRKQETDQQNTQKGKKQEEETSSKSESKEEQATEAAEPADVEEVKKDDAKKSSSSQKKETKKQDKKAESEESESGPASEAAKQEADSSKEKKKSSGKSAKSTSKKSSGKAKADTEETSEAKAEAKPDEDSAGEKASDEKTKDS